jgi:osmoprotectant transport system permease protein
MRYLLLIFLIAALYTDANSANAQTSTGQTNVSVGSKAFTEGYILAEIAAQTLEAQPGTQVTRRFGMGGTGILIQAIQNGEIDLYPEYTGTIAEALLKESKVKSQDESRDLKSGISSLRQALKPMGLTISQSLGFNNTYALAVREEFARVNHLKKISDLKSLVQQTRVAFSNEFMTRPDGYAILRAAYGLEFPNLKSLEHSLAYEAIHHDQADLTDVYSTDAKIPKLNLHVLEDDQKVFPDYEAVWLARLDFTRKHPKLWAALSGQEGKWDKNQMQALNAKVDVDKIPYADAVNNSLRGTPLAASSSGAPWSELALRTKQHLFLVLFSLALSILVGLPLGILAAHNQGLGQAILLFSSTVQTIPSLALLCFLIPFFGIGTTPALAALFLYGLLPIVVNTSTALASLDAGLKETARALGLGFYQSLWKIELPLASPSILAGIKTSCIIGIGTATLAALIGAGGYGVPIVTGLAFNDMKTILTGALPAALMALVAHGIFEVLGLILLPKPLRRSFKA